MTTRPFKTGLLLAALISAIGCGGGDVGPVSGPGSFIATLESPNGVEGASLIHLIGGGVSSVQPLSGELFTSTSGDTTKVLVVLSTPGDVAFRVQVADTTQPPIVVLLQVADGDNRVRSSLQGYSVRLSQ